MRRTTLRRDGLDLVVHERGEGRPVLLQHGLGGAARQVAEVWPDLPGWRQVTLDCRGHGESPMGAASMALLADDLASLAEELQPPLVLGGISMGAALALRLAVRRPELVRALVLIRPAWVADAAPKNMAPVAEVADLLRCWPPEVARTRFLEGATALRLRQEAPDNLSSLLGYFDQPRPGFAEILGAIAKDGPGISESEIAGLRLPSLVLSTAEDSIHPLSTARQLADLVPSARLVELPPKGRDRSAHVDALQRALADFLKELT